MIIELYIKYSKRILRKFGYGLSKKEKKDILKKGVSIFSFLYSCFKFILIAWILNKVYLKGGFAEMVILSSTIIIFYLTRQK